MSTVEENVARGIVWLNENLGKDWPDFIDRETLNLRFGDRCLLGQVFGAYFTALDVLGTSESWGHDLGFSVAWDGNVSFFDLQCEWDNYLDEYELANA